VANGDGFYLMHRGWQDHPVFRGEAFSKRDAFVWLIEEAAYSQRRVPMPSGEVVLARGQVGHSYRFMAKAWRWEESKVRRFIASLQKAEIIDAATAAGQTVITVCNYDKYQARPADTTAPDAAAAPQHRRGGTANDKEGNQGKEQVDVARAPEAVAVPAAAPLAPDDRKDAMVWVNRFGQAAGVPVFPSRPQHFADQISATARWLALGLDPETEIIPILQRDAERTSQTRHSLAYFDAHMTKAAAKKDRANDPQRASDPAEHASPLARAALRAAAAREGG
jgi:hypothetical protein